MIAPLSRVYRLIGLAAIAWGWTAGGVAAQPPDQWSMTKPTFAVVNPRVPVGSVVFVTDTTGATIKGKLAALTDAAVKVTVGADVRNFPAAEVRRIEWQQQDSPLPGLLIGAAIGAIPGIYWLAVDPNECTGMCPEEYAAIAISAVVGGLIDHVIRKKITVYSAGGSIGREAGVMIGPLVGHNRKGIHFGVRFKSEW